MDEEARRRIEDLEYRLFKYHEWLNEAIEQRDRLAIDAAWGVHYALYSTLAYAAVIYGVTRYFGELGWLGSLAAGIGLVVVQGVIHAWSNGARMKEVDTFHKLPEWEWKTD